MNTKKLVWTTVQKKVSDLIPQEVNPRKITDKQMSGIIPNSRGLKQPLYPCGIWLKVLTFNNENKKTVNIAHIAIVTR